MRVVIPTVVYGSEMGLLRVQERRNICCIKRVGRVRNSLIRDMCKCELKLSVLEIIERNVLKWFGHVERMGRKCWLREGIRQMWRVTTGGRNHREDGGEKEGDVLARDREAWGRMVYRSE